MSSDISHFEVLMIEIWKWRNCFRKKTTIPRLAGELMNYFLKENYHSITCARDWKNYFRKKTTIHRLVGELMNCLWKKTAIHRLQMGFSYEKASEPSSRQNFHSSTQVKVRQTVFGGKPPFIDSMGKLMNCFRGENCHSSALVGTRRRSPMNVTILSCVDCNIPIFISYFFN